MIRSEERAMLLQPQPIAESTLSLIPQCIAFASAVQGGESNNAELAIAYLKGKRELEVLINGVIPGVEND